MPWPGPLAGLLTHRLLRVGTCGSAYRRHARVLAKLTPAQSKAGTFSTGCARCNEKDGDSSEPPPASAKVTPRQALLAGRRRALSPLERLSHLLPQDAMSPEVLQLREQERLPEEDAGIHEEQGACDMMATQQDDPGMHTGGGAMPVGDDSGLCHTSDAAAALDTAEARLSGARQMSPLLPGEKVLVFGELLVAELYKKRRVEFRKMFRLTMGARLQSSWGIIHHDDIAGQPAGRFLKTGRGVPILIRRVSLEDYVLCMKRGPAIAYPKDAATMLMMMDVTQGDNVLESGSGSGAMSLFLSRAVGSSGSVLSVEVREDHHKRAVLNYNCWRTSWSLGHGEDWPDNVQFHHADLCTASPLLAGQGFSAVALDLLSPQLVLPTVIPHLHPGGVCVVYLANITQVIDLLDGLRCFPLPLLCERIIEIPIRDWLVAPALQKDGQYCSRKALIPDGAQREDDDDTSDQAEKESHPAFGSVPYIARPHPEQFGHTAFLVKLRKCVR